MVYLAQGTGLSPGQLRHLVSGSLRVLVWLCLKRRGHKLTPLALVVLDPRIDGNVKDISDQIGDGDQDRPQHRQAQ